MEKSIIIIGAGLTGLSAGCYGRMNGYRTSIYEMHDKAGGVCTAWKRKDYTIDGAMNWLIGTKPGTGYHRIWQELGAADNWKVHNHSNYMILEDENGSPLPVPCNTDHLEEFMLKVSPEDRSAIIEFCNTVRSCWKISLPVDKPPELYTLVDKLKMVKMLPRLGFFAKWGKLTVLDFADRFHSPLLKKIFTMGNDDAYSIMPALTLPMLFSWMNEREAGYVLGGALSLVDSIRKRYTDLGGEIHFKAKVEKILIEDGKAVGIRLSDGTEHRGDYIISAADGHETIFDMLEGRYIDDEIRGYYKNLKLFPPLIYTAFGVNRSFREIPPSLNGYSFALEKPVTIAERERRDINVLIYNYDPSLAGNEKTTIVVPMNTDFDYWENLYGDKEKYKAEKEAIADTLLNALETRFPGITEQTEVRDVATPMTWVRYTGNWRGSYEGWLMSSKTMMMEMSKTLPGLKNFFMAGQWVNPGGGMPTAAVSGNHTIQLICREDRKKFTASRPAHN